MEIYLDLEKTLWNDQNKLANEAYEALKLLAKRHRVVILTASPFCEITDLFSIENLTIVSTLENRSYTGGKFTDSFIDISLEKILSNPYLYTLYTVKEDTCYVYKYQERLKPFYPAKLLRLWPRATFSLNFFVLAIYKEGLASIKEELSSYSIEILGEDSKKVLLKVTKTPSTKESYLKKLKESPAIGIGDSFKDYDFIKHCEIQVAMKNGDLELKKVCSYVTKYTNQDAGAIEFLLTYLKLQQA